MIKSVSCSQRFDDLETKPKYKRNIQRYKISNQHTENMKKEKEKWNFYVRLK